MAILYNVFFNDFVSRRCSYEGCLVVYNKNKNRENKEASFWHLIEKDDPEYGRIPDFPRARRINWIRPVIENRPDPVVTYLESLSKKGKKRVYLWLRELDYVVILEEGRKPGVVVLITAFVVDEFKRRDYEKKLRNSQ